MNQICNEDISKCSNKYPFQHWGGSVDYKGFIVDENGKFIKTKFLDMDLNCPYKYMEIISNWNENEYGNGSDIHLPRSNCEINKNELKLIKVNGNEWK